MTTFALNDKVSVNIRHKGGSLTATGTVTAVPNGETGRGKNRYSVKLDNKERLVRPYASQLTGVVTGTTPNTI